MGCPVGPSSSSRYSFNRQLDSVRERWVRHHASGHPPVCALAHCPRSRPRLRPASPGSHWRGAHGPSPGTWQHVDNWLSRRASMIALVIAGLAAAVTLQFSTFSASGSDASGYLSQADMLWRRQIMRAEPLASVAQWTNAAATLAPLGWHPARENGFQVPTYAPGLPLLMAPLHALGGAIAASLVPAVSFFIVVCATAALALRLSGALAALIAAVWIASSPVALIEAMQPMSDVPVTAAWLVCWILIMPWGRAGYGRALLLGGWRRRSRCSSVPTLRRWRSFPRCACSSRTTQRSLRGTPSWLLPARVALAGVLVAYLQWRWFGSPLPVGIWHGGRNLRDGQRPAECGALLSVAVGDARTVAARGARGVDRCRAAVSCAGCCCSRPRWWRPTWCTQCSKSGPTCDSCCRRWRSRWCWWRLWSPNS